MRTPLRRPIHQLLGIAAAGVLTLAACGEDGDSGGSADVFCDEIAKLAESGGDTTEEEDLAALKAVADVAPSEISDEMDELLSGFEQVQAFDAESASEDEFTDFLAIAASLDQASIAIEEFATEKCPDLPANFFSTE